MLRTFAFSFNWRRYITGADVDPDDELGYNVWRLEVAEDVMELVMLFDPERYAPLMISSFLTRPVWPVTYCSPRHRMRRK